MCEHLKNVVEGGPKESIEALQDVLEIWTN